MGNPDRREPGRSRRLVAPHSRTNPGPSPRMALAPNHTAESPGFNACSSGACAGPRLGLWPRSGLPQWSPRVTNAGSGLVPPGASLVRGKGPHFEAPVLRCDITGTLMGPGVLRDGKGGGWDQQKKSNH